MKVNREQTQKKVILNWLKEGKEINPLQALHNFGCFRLAAVIFVLKDEGYNITTRMVQDGSKRYASYKLIKDN